MLLMIECGLVLLALILAFAFPRVGECWFGPIERRFARLAKRKLLAVVVVGATTLLLRVALLPVLPIPDPAVHDEFSYLLGADTFSHGRLANPTHPMWVHFETFHVNQKPTYVSIYYPAQGLFLAFGQIVFGHPFWGVWLSAGLMCAAICWMLQGWLPPFWALLGGFLAVIRLGTFSYWMNSYWGGAVAALGGALVLGSLPRIKRHQRIRDAILMGIGFAILANSRPYEGLVLSVPVFAALVLWMFRRKAPLLRVLVPRLIAPLLVLCSITLGSMGYYFWRTTGSPFHTPYLINNNTYRPVAFFPWQHSKTPPPYNHAVMRAFYTGWEEDQFDLAVKHPFVLLLLKFWKFWLFFLGPLFTFVLVAVCFALPVGLSLRDLSHKTRFLMATLGVVFIGALLPVCFAPHYLAPAVPVLYALLLIAMLKIRRLRPWNRPVGIAMVRAVPVTAVLICLFPAIPSIAAKESLSLNAWDTPEVVHSYRSAIAARLDAMPGRHLVIVHYEPEHCPMFEWVYNRADIDDAHVVWARDMGPERNQELIDYFKNRQVWRVNPDALPPQLKPYSTRFAGTPDVHSAKLFPQESGH